MHGNPCALVYVRILTHYLECAGLSDVDPGDFRRQRRIVLVPRDHGLRVSDRFAYEITNRTVRQRLVGWSVFNDRR